MKKESVKEKGAMELLSIIYDKVQRIKAKDRFIVASKEGWGVANGNGDIIIPSKFTLITYSSSKLFRVYGEGSGVYTLQYELKYQGVYDLNGNVMLPLGLYGECIKFRNGLIFGQNNLTQSNNQQGNCIIAYVNSDIGCYRFEDDVNSIIVIKGVDDILLAFTVNNSCEVIRADKGFQRYSLDQAWDKLTKINLSEINDTAYEDYLKSLGITEQLGEKILKASRVLNDKIFYIAETSESKHVLNEMLVPVIATSRRDYKTIYR